MLSHSMSAHPPCSVAYTEQISQHNIIYIFEDNGLPAALVDQLIYNSHIVIFSGENYRLTQSMQRQLTR